MGRKSHFLTICKAMVQTGSKPDFITVDGGDGGTGAAPMEFSLKRHIKIIASGKVVTGFDIVKNISLGADICNSARGMMMAVGCIQALECNTNTCPTGVATQDKELQKGLVVEEKKQELLIFITKQLKARWSSCVLPELPIPINCIAD